MSLSKDKYYRFPFFTKVCFLLLIFSFLYLDFYFYLIFAVTLISILLTILSVFAIIWMLYAWENPDDIDENRSPNTYDIPQYSITALLPARHEENVISDTITAINSINYPDHLKQTLVLVRIDDYKTIEKVECTIKKLGKNNIQLITFDGNPINKPHALNLGLKYAKNDLITVFDAEDQPHPDIYNVINTVFCKKKCDVVQSGVQLINYRSHWFSALNCIEYYLWFKSGLPFFNRYGGACPLAGNSVFIKKGWLKYIGGWDDKCLTEDADIGIRLTAAGAQIKVIYDEKHATQEETPSGISGFIKQRTRWNQGFLQIFNKKDWQNLPEFRQRTVIAYLLLTPFLQIFYYLYISIGVFVALNFKLPVWLTLLSFIPFYLILLQIISFSIALFKFTRDYGLKYTFFTPLRILVPLYPYQILLVLSSLRAFYRVIIKSYAWEKTLHKNEHRLYTPIMLSGQYAK